MQGPQSNSEPEGQTGADDSKPGESQAKGPGTSDPLRKATREEKKKPKKRGLWKRRLLVALALMLSGCLALWLGRNRVLAPFLLERLGPQLEASLGGRLRIARFEGNWFGELALRDIRFARTAPEGPLVRFEASNIVLRYDLLKLVQDGLGGLLSLDVEAQALVLAPTSALPGSAAESESDSGPMALPLHLPELEVRVAQVDLQLDEGSLSASDVTLEAKADQVRLRVAQFDPRAVAPNAPHGELSCDLGWRGSRITLEEARFDDVLSAGPGSFDLSSLGVASPAPEGGEAGPLMTLERLVLKGHNNEISAHDLVLPALTMNLEQAVAKASGEFQATIADLPALLQFFRADATSKHSPPNVPDHSVQFSCRLASNRLVLEAGSVVASDGNLKLKRGEVQFASGAGDSRAGDSGDSSAWWRDALVDVDFDLDFPDLVPLGRLIEQDDLSGSIAGQLHFKGSPRNPRLGLEAGARSLDWGALRLGGLNFSAQLSGPTDALDGEIDLSLEDASLGNESLQALDLHGLLRGGQLDIDHLEAKFRDYVLGAALKGQWNSNSRGGWLEVRRLTLARGQEELRLAAPARIEGQGGQVSANQLAFQGPSGRMFASARFANASFGAVKDQNPATNSVGLVFEDFALGSMASDLLPMGWDLSPLVGSLQAQWQPGSNGLLPQLLGSELQGQLKLSAPAVTLGIGAQPLDAELELDLDQNVLLVQGISIRRAGLGQVTCSGRVPLVPLKEAFGSPALGIDADRDGSAEDLSLKLKANTTDISAWPAALQQALFGTRLSVAGKLDLDGDLSGSWEALGGALALQGRQLKLTDRVSGQVLDDVKLGLTLDLGPSLRIPTCELQLGELAQLSLTAQCATALNLPALARGEMDDFRGAELTGKLSCDSPDLGFVAAQLEGVRRLEGSLKAQVSVGGSLNNPNVAGELNLGDVSLRLSNAFPALQDLAASLQFHGDQLQVAHLGGKLGGAPFEITGGVSALHEKPRFDINLRGKDLLLARDEGLRVRADTNLQMTGELQALLLKGEISLTDGRYGEAIAILGGLTGESKAPSGGRGLDLSLAQSGPLADLQLDLDLNASQPFRLATNLVKGGLRPNLHVTGDGRVPLLDGNVFLEPTQVSLPSGIMSVDSGRVLFDPADPFVPKLELNGGIRLRGFDITAVVSGDFDDPEVRLASTPPLPNQDLLVLFLTGQLPEGSTGSRSRAAAQSVAVYFAKDYVSRWLAGPSESEKESILTRLDVTIGNDVTRSGALTTEVTYRLGQRAKGTGRERYLTGERDVYDKINFGFGWRFRFD